MPTGSRPPCATRSMAYGLPSALCYALHGLRAPVRLVLRVPWPTGSRPPCATRSIKSSIYIGRCSKYIHLLASESIYNRTVKSIHTKKPGALRPQHQARKLASDRLLMANIQTAYIIDAMPLPPSQPIIKVMAYFTTVNTNFQISSFFISSNC